jgi:NitT/TauT family transport system substrate-binding protein
MKKIRLITNALILFLFFGLTSCTKKSTDVIRIGILQGPTAISFIHLMANPPQIEGKKIKFIIKSDPQQIQALMLKNELEFAVLPTVMAANLYNKKLNYSMVACPVWGTLYIVTNKAETQKIGDLTGKSISVFGQGATPDVLLQRFLEQKNIDNVKIDYSFTNNNDLSMAMLNGRVQTAVVSEPMVSLLQSKSSDIHVVSKLNLQEYFENSDKDIFTQTAFVVRNEFSREYPTTMHEICEAYSSSCNFVNEQPERTAKLLVEYRIVTNEAIALASLPFCNIRYVASFAIEQEIKKYLEIFHEFNPATIGGKMPNRNFIYQPQ